MDLVRVLLVDDTVDLRVILAGKLAETGMYEIVAQGGDGQAAIDLAREHKPDLVLLDVSMPVMGGAEALPHVRALLPFAAIVILTGSDRDSLNQQLTDLGADAVLIKGDRMRDLLSAIEDTVARVLHR